jgi:SAM-dependent methyltransferase
MVSVSQQVHETIEAVALAVSANDRADFASRAAAMERLEVHVLDRLQYLDDRGALPADLHELRGQAAALHERLNAANERILQRLHGRISAGRYTPEGIKRAFARYAAPDGQRGYDVLDLIVAGLLDGGRLADERAVREPEMVAYQPTPARAILTLIERASILPSDVFYDLGSGLGRVVLLVALLSGARAKGIEFEPVYCDYADRCARSLNLSDVEIIHADARNARLADGTVYFLYTPFRGVMLAQVLERLRAEARKRSIRVCTYGPCTTEVAGTSWLWLTNGSLLDPHRVAVFYSGRPGPARF